MFNHLIPKIMFFTQFNQLMAENVDIMMVIHKSATGMTVSVLPKPNGLNDDARNHIVPLLLSGTPQELDAGFFQTVTRPVQKVSGLLSNMTEFERQADKAAKESRAAKDMKAKESREEKEKREKFDRLTKKADDLIAAGNHKEAVTVLGQARAYASPQQVKEIDEKIAAQTAEVNSGSLFGMAEFDRPPAPQPSPQPAQVQPPLPQQRAPQPAPYTGGHTTHHRPAQPYPVQGGQYPPHAAYGQHMKPQPAAPPQYDGYPVQDNGRHPYIEDDPDYKPEDYSTYLDFPSEMLNRENRYQNNNPQM